MCGKKNIVFFWFASGDEIRQHFNLAKKKHSNFNGRAMIESKSFDFQGRILKNASFELVQHRC